MTIIDKVRHAFVGCEQGAIYTTAEIKNMVKTKYCVNEDSVIPSDYCYNLTNKGKLNDSTLDKFKIFEWISWGKYRFLGENYPYKGSVIRNPRK